MTNRMQELWDDMAERCGWSVVLSRLSNDDPNAASPAIGAIVVDDVSGTTIAFEAGVDDMGAGTIAVRMFDGEFNPIAPKFVEVGDSLMIFTR